MADQLRQQAEKVCHYLGNAYEGEPRRVIRALVAELESVSLVPAWPLKPCADMGAPRPRIAGVLGTPEASEVTSCPKCGALSQCDAENLCCGEDCPLPDTGDDFDAALRELNEAAAGVPVDAPKPVKAADFECVKQAARDAHKQFDHYRKVMGEEDGSGVATGDGSYMRHKANETCECHDCHIARTRGVQACNGCQRGPGCAETCTALAAGVLGTPEASDGKAPE